MGRRIDVLARRVELVDGKIDRFGDMAVGARLGDIDRRLDAIERVMTTGANQRSSATWQALFLVLGMIASMAGGIALSAVLK
ncbi:MAG: hypothetical protein LC798_16865 [Chloroflexi bacterium]|nr:hypothetical protein [Chloroflexota bacterium]